ncbi:chorismate mutase [Saccharopolyspora sp. NPDC047091]|uniref:chorismate mutase n=1 Tax=Saccharopolyspora sp. NPDC047091 TaxID=3155924 RepID=UPI003406C3BF
MRRTMLTGLALGVLISTAAPATAASAPAPEPAEAALTALVDLAAQRLLLADEVAAAKYGTGAPIEDPPREREVLDAVAELSTEAGLNPADGVRFFRHQIEAGKEVQRGLFAEWDAHPELRPDHRPDLGADVRPELDRISAGAVRELRRTEPVREPTDECRLDLAAAAVSAVFGHRLDALHRGALTEAVGTICE